MRRDHDILQTTRTRYGAVAVATDQANLDAIADELNGRPRQTLQWMTPSEKLTEFLATTG